jgi:ribosomal protein L24
MGKYILTGKRRGKVGRIVEIRRPYQTAMTNMLARIDEVLLYLNWPLV